MMIGIGALVILYGTSVFAGPLLPTEIVVNKMTHDMSNEVEYLPASGPSPFISNFIQKGTNVFFKPQFMLSSGQMPSQVQSLISAIEKDDCKTSLPIIAPAIIDEPLRIVEKEMNPALLPRVKEVIEIKPAPVLPPLSMMPAIVETPVVPCAHDVEIIDSKPEWPLVPIQVVEEPKIPVMIPPAPVLPPMELVQLPLVVEELAPVPEIPCEHPMAPVPFVQEEVHVPVAIPQAPILPPMEMPQLPLIVEEIAPVPEIPCDQPIVSVPVVHEEVHVPVVIPQAPILPPMEMPQLPLVVDEIAPVPEIPCDDPLVPVPVVHEEVHVPVVIPQAPILLPMELPQLPLVVEEIAPVPEIPCDHPLVPVPVVHEEVHVPIPSAPILSPMEIPQLPLVVEGIEMPCEEPVHVPIPVLHEEESYKPIAVPPAPVLTPLEIIQEIPAPFHQEIKPVIVPEAPVLPPFTLPELPVRVEEMPTVSDPCPPASTVIMQPMPPVQIPVQTFVSEPVHEIVRPIPSAPAQNYYEIPKVTLVSNEVHGYQSVHEMTVPCEHEHIVAPVVDQAQPTYVSYPTSFATHPIQVLDVASTPSLSDIVMPTFNKHKLYINDFVGNRILPKPEHALRIVPVSNTKLPVSWSL